MTSAENVYVSMQFPTRSNVKFPSLPPKTIKSKNQLLLFLDSQVFNDSPKKSLDCRENRKLSNGDGQSCKEAMRKATSANVLSLLVSINLMHINVNETQRNSSSLCILQRTIKKKNIPTCSVREHESRVSHVQTDEKGFNASHAAALPPPTGCGWMFPRGSSSPHLEGK